MGAPTNRIELWRKDLIGTVPDAHGALLQISTELFGDKVIAVGSPANQECHATYEFAARGHVFTVSVKPDGDNQPQAGA